MNERLPAPQRRQLLLEAAKDLFARYGVAGVTTAAVVKRCDVTEPIFYRHFSSKRALLRQLVEDVIHRVAQDMGTLARRETDPVAALRSIIGHYPEISHEYAREFSIINRALAEIQDVPTRRLLKAHYEGYLAILERIISDGQRRGNRARTSRPISAHGI